MKTAEQIMKGKRFIKEEMDKQFPNSDALWQKAEARLGTIMEKYPGIPNGVRVHTDNYIFPSAAIYLTLKEAVGRENAYAVIENSAIKHSTDVGRKIASLLKLPGMKSLFIKIWDPLTRKVFGPNSGFKNVFYPKKRGEYRMDVVACPYNKYFSPTIVTMVNSLETHEQWEAICGNGRVLPAFPGAGGGFDGDVLDAALTPRLIQPTTIGRIDGKEKVLVRLFRKAGIPCQIVADMHAWQICHLALVVPLADAYYEAADPERAGCDAALMRRTALRIRANLGGLDRRGMRLSPGKLRLFRSLPTWLMGFILGVIYRSDFGHRFMYRHSMKAPDEMRRLHDAFYGEMEREG